MKICKNCKSIFQDNSKTLCPRCNLLLSGDYSLYDQKDLVNDISNSSKTLWSISWRVFLMLFTVLGVLGVITGYNIYGHLQNLNDKINLKISQEFEKPNITKTIQTVAKENADKLINNQIEPEVKLFKLTINNLVKNTDSIIISKTNQFSDNLEHKSKIIDDKVALMNESLKQIENSETEILKIEKEMNKIKELAKPPTLRQVGFNMETIDNGLKITIIFEPTKNEPLGRIKFKVTILDNTQLFKIYTDVKYGAFTGSDNGRIANNKIGEYEYSLIGTGYPAIVIEVSKKCNFSIESNYLDEPFNVYKSEY
jgi:hypothetical protein